MKKLLPLAALAALVLNSGCVTGQRTIDLAGPPTAPAAATVAAVKGKVCITAVTDHRTFQNKPSDPSIPSIDGNVAKLTPDKQDKMIGRQRGTWGNAAGDIALPAGDSVTQRVRALVTQGLRARGYEVTDDAGAPTTVAVTVDEFWSWMTPGMWALTFEAKLHCVITLKNAAGSATLDVRGKGLNHGQFAKNENWQQAFEPAFKDFLANLDTELGKAEPK